VESFLIVAQGGDGGGGALELLIKIGLVVIFIVGPYLLNLFGGQAVQRDRGERAKPRPQQNPNRGGEKAELEDEIEAFLRQSKQGRAGSKPRRVEPLTESESGDAAGPDQSEIVPAQTSSLKNRHIEPSMAKQDGAFHHEPDFDHSEELSDDYSEPIDEASYLDEPSAYEDQEVAIDVNSIKEMIRNPAQVRSAIIFSEILKRPDITSRR